jgi:hypothetical protein
MRVVSLSMAFVTLGFRCSEKKGTEHAQSGINPRCDGDNRWRCGVEGGCNTAKRRSGASVE